MRGLRAFCRLLYDAQLVEWNENDSCSGIELGLQDLDHRGVGRIQLQYPTTSASRRIVCPLGQFDDVELVDFVRYSHSLSMLGNRKGSYQPWGISFKRVVPRNDRRSYAPFDREMDCYSTCNTERGAIAHELNRRVGCRFCNRRPHLVAVAGTDMENAFPFSSVPFLSKDPFQLTLLIPGIRDAGKKVTGFRWPLHGGDARKQRRACVQLKLILFIGNRTKVKQDR